TNLWQDRKCELPPGADPADLIHVPDDALYYAALGCVEVASGEAEGVGLYQGTERLSWWIDEGQHQEKAKSGAKALIREGDDLASFKAAFEASRGSTAASARSSDGPVFIGCDFGSTTAKAVVMDSEKEILASVYVQSKGNPIEDAKALFRDIREKARGSVAGLALTGYGKDLLKDILGADTGVVETVAHATSALHIFPDADVICDVGGTDVKIM